MFSTILANIIFLPIVAFGSGFEPLPDMAPAISVATFEDGSYQAQYDGSYYTGCVAGMACGTSEATYLLGGTLEIDGLTIEDTDDYALKLTADGSVNGEYEIMVTQLEYSTGDEITIINTEYRQTLISLVSGNIYCYAMIDGIVTDVDQDGYFTIDGFTQNVCG